jgi:hypothetical protein
MKLRLNLAIFMWQVKAKKINNFQLTLPKPQTDFAN